jgi:hypothetical protein
MAFLRFTRDKRGYEHFYLVESSSNRRGKVRSRVLYWFRTPPNIKVGREPFDDGVRRMLEAQNPGVEFDWPAILETPIPSADAERWRERRRAERAARSSRSDDDRGDAPDADLDEQVASPVVLIGPSPPAAQSRDDTLAASDGAVETVSDAAREREDVLDSAPGHAPDPTGSEPVHAAVLVAIPSDVARRKRRRRRRGRPHQAGAQPPADSTPPTPAEPQAFASGTDGDADQEDGE